MRRPVEGQSLALLSCGIDSLATLRWNALTYPREHPDAIAASLFVAYDADPMPSLERLHRVTRPRTDAVLAVAADVGTVPIPVRTNMWWLAPDGWFFTDKWHGAVLASLASFFARGYRRGYVPSSDSPATVAPYGSHPLLDPSYGSAHFQIEHDLFGMRRMDKVALIAAWPAGRANVRVCTNDTEGGPNCGTCEKCIRTQLQFAALGEAAAAAMSFPGQGPTPRLVGLLEEYDMIRGHPDLVVWYAEAIPGLRRHGLGAVGDALERVLTAVVGEDAALERSLHE